MRLSIVLILLISNVSLFGQSISAVGLGRMPGDSLAAEKLLDLSEVYAFSDPGKAKEYAEKAVELARQAGDTGLEIGGLYHLGSYYMRQGDRERAKPYFDSGLGKSREYGVQLLTARGLFHLSHYYESETDYATALDYLKQSFSISERLGHKKNMADANTSFGRIFEQLGSYDRSLARLFQALDIYEELEDQRGISDVKTMIGNVYLLTDKYDEALVHFSESLLVSRSVDDPEGIYYNLYRMGVAYQKKDAFEEALKRYQDALPIARRLNYSVDEAILLGNIGSTLRQQGHPEEALEYLFSSLQLRDEIDYNPSHNLNDIAETYLALHNPEEAEKYALLAIESSKLRSDLGQLNYAYYMLAKAAEKLGDFEQAYSALDRFDTTKDSLFSLEKARQMDQLEVLYETEKKEQEIDLLTLQKENAEFRRNAYLGSGVLLTLLLLLLYLGQRNKSAKNRQLLEKEKEVAEMKSNFFSNISHEFRTPLTLILGPIDMVRKHIGDPKIRNQLNVMKRNANRLLSLINQILDLSRLESGKLELSAANNDIVTILRGVTMTFESLAEMREIELLVDTRLELLEFRLDREKVETILVNLVTNAFKYTPEGGRVAVSLDLGENQAGNNECRIIVRDTGDGIPEQELPHVFERFYRGSESGTRVGVGTGIGLALTKELVELHGGRIEVSSRVGEGAQFTVTIPIGPAGYRCTYREGDRSVIRITDAASPAQPEPEWGDGEGSLGRSTDDRESTPIVLLIEDNADVLQYLKEILGETYRVVEARDGEAGVEMAFERIPDLIVSDVMMPKMDGYRVAEMLKQDEKTSHIPLILLTAKASQNDRIQGWKTHADEYLTKPFSPDELRVRIQNLIESRDRLRQKYKREFMMRPDEITVNSMDDAFLLRVREAVEEHIDDEHFTVKQLGREVGMSRSQVHRKLVALTDQSATEYIRSYRLYRARDMIAQDAGSISEIAFAVGFGSPSYFSKCFREEFGKTPSKARPSPG